MWSHLAILTAPVTTADPAHFLDRIMLGLLGIIGVTVTISILAIIVKWFIGEEDDINPVASIVRRISYKVFYVLIFAGLAGMGGVFFLTTSQGAWLYASQGQVQQGTYTINESGGLSWEFQSGGSEGWAPSGLPHQGSTGQTFGEALNEGLKNQPYQLEELNKIDPDHNFEILRATETAMSGTVDVYNGIKNGNVSSILKGIGTSMKNTLMLNPLATSSNVLSIMSSGVHDLDNLPNNIGYITDVIKKNQKNSDSTLVKQAADKVRSMLKDKDIQNAYKKRKIASEGE